VCDAGAPFHGPGEDARVPLSAMASSVSASPASSSAVSETQHVVKEEEQRQRLFRGEICQQYCKRQACAIQDCLAKTGFQESPCAAVVRDFETCCDFVVSRYLRAQAKKTQRSCGGTAE
jgi:hypothetical protein